MDAQNHVADRSPEKPAFQMRRFFVPLLCAVTMLSLFAATFFAGQSHALRNKTVHAPELRLPTLDATAAVSSDKFSMATGFVSDRAEGLFVLDHNSGLLQCSVMYPRLGRFMGLFTVNVQEALGTGRGAQYMMTTGMVDMPSSTRTPLASSVVYVLNTTTGNYACYSIPFNRVMMNSGQPQQQKLILVATGSADPVIDRDAIR